MRKTTITIQETGVIWTMGLRVYLAVSLAWRKVNQA